MNVALGRSPVSWGVISGMGCAAIGHFLFREISPTWPKKGICCALCRSHPKRGTLKLSDPVKVPMSQLASDVFSEAVDAWLQHCEIHDLAPRQPSLAESSMDERGIITLRNSEGFLAQYSSSMKRILTNL